MNIFRHNLLTTVSTKPSLIVTTNYQIKAALEEQITVLYRSAIVECFAGSHSTGGNVSGKTFKPETPEQLERRFEGDASRKRRTNYLRQRYNNYLKIFDPEKAMVPLTSPLLRGYHTMRKEVLATLAEHDLEVRMTDDFVLMAEDQTMFDLITLALPHAVVRLREMRS